MATPAPHPAYRGLADYDALKARSNANYDAEDAGLREAPDYGGFNNTMNLIASSQNKQSPWSPYFQSLQDQGVSKLSQDAARPHGIADNPEWQTQGDVGALAPPTNPNAMVGQDLENYRMMRPNSIVSPAVAGLRKAGGHYAIAEP